MKLRLILPLLGAAAFSTSAYIAQAGSSAPKYLPVDVKPVGSAPQGKAASKAAPAAAVTFNKDIAPIVFENCSSCHRPGQVAPFSLLSYEDVRKRGQMIAQVTRERLMPPWQADEGAEKFHDARRLAPAQIELIQKWAASGMPEGEARPRSAAPQFTSGWKFGEPDATFEPEAAYSLQAEGADVYRCFVIPTGYKADRYISSLEVQPSNRAIVHHVIAYLDQSGRARELDKAGPGPGYTSFGGPGFLPSGTLGGWAPGNEPRLLPAGIGMLLPANADIVLQVHYHKSGKPEADRTRIGLTFARGPVDKRMRVMPLLYRRLRIPAGESNYVVGSDLTTPIDATVHAVMPHMHLLGREMTVSATRPDASTQKLVRVPNWDFNWQTTYVFKEPIRLPAGSKVEMKARYDNSPGNPLNPSDPPREVRWGEQTTDEMCIAFLYYTADQEHLTQGQTVQNLPDGFGGAAFRRSPGGAISPRGALGWLGKMFDKDGDGILDPQEKAARDEFLRRNRQR